MVEFSHFCLAGRQAREILHFVQNDTIFVKTEKEYQNKIYLFLDKFLRRKTNEAKKEAAQTYYFLDNLQKYIARNRIKEPIFPAALDLNICASLTLIKHFFTIFDALTWKKSALKNDLTQNIFKKYQNDKTKNDPQHIAFSQVLILGDIVSGFAYELVLISKFSDQQKVKILEEINNIIKWHEIEKLSGKKKFDYFTKGVEKIAFLVVHKIHRN
ncbi:MAG: hypothetical protein AB1465_05235 [Patescibacteria group bacterium]